MRGDSGRWARRAAIALIAAAVVLPAEASALPLSSDTWQGAEQLTPSVRLETDPATFTVQPDEPFTHTSSGCAQSGTNTLMGSTMWWYVVGTGGDIVVSSEWSTVDSMVAVYRGDVTTPTQAQAIGCWDDNVGSTRNARIRITGTAPGARYLVQLGRCAFFGAAFTPCASPPGRLAISAVTNDQRAFPEPATGGARSNQGTGLEPGEPASCNGAAYDATVWFRWTAPAAGWVNVTASRFDTVLSLFTPGGASPLACSDGSRPDDPLTERLRTYVQPGDYLIQVGGKGGAQDNFTYDVAFEPDLDLDKDGSPRPDDCNDGNPAVRPGRRDVAHNGVDEDCVGGDNKDQDGDGHAAKFAGGDDCNDKNLHINPMVNDKPNNGVDEDCKRGDKPAQLPTSPQISFLSNAAGASGRIFGVLRVRNLRKGYKVTVRCKGSPACPGRLKKKLRKGSSVTFPQYFGKILGRGTKVEIRVTTKGNVLGFLKRYSVRGAGNPKQTACALKPKSGRAVRCRRG